MKFFILLLSSGIAMAGNPVEKADHLRRIDEPRIPGTAVPLEKMNTAPTDLQLQEEEKPFRNTLRARKSTQKEMKEEVEIKRK